MTYTGDNPNYKYVFHIFDKNWFTHDVPMLYKNEIRDTWFIDVAEEIEHQLELQGALP